ASIWPATRADPGWPRAAPACHARARRLRQAGMAGVGAISWYWERLADTGRLAPLVVVRLAD
ncbi:MAG: hypothetical protein ACREF3_15460, partial [Acetobacteraceae bacterium]